MKTFFKWIFWIFAVVYFLAAAVVLSVRFFATPYLMESKPKIEQLLSSALGRPSTIGELKVEWDHLTPYITIKNLSIAGTGSVPALTVDSVVGAFSWRSLLYWSPVFSQINVEGPRLMIERTGQETFDLNGFPLVEPSSESSDSSNAGAAWFLRQRSIIVNNGRVDYVDQMNQGKTLPFFNVSLNLKNGPITKQYALRAVPPVTLAQPLDIRAEFQSPRLQAVPDFQNWSGRVYGYLPYINFRELQNWLPKFDQNVQGSGAGKVWVTLNDWVPQKVTFDGALSDFTVKLGKDLEPLAFNYLKGSFTGNVTPKELAFSTDNLNFQLKNRKPSPELKLTFDLTRNDAGDLESGNVKFNVLHLKQVASLFPSLPIPESLKEFVRKRQLDGTLNQTEVSWVGPISNPTTYEGSLEFEGLRSEGQSGKNGNIWLPGFRNLSGKISAGDKGGSIKLWSKDAELAFPGIFPVASFHLSNLDAEASWKLDKRLDVAVTRIHVKNSDLEAELSGEFKKEEGELGEINLQGKLPWANLPAMWKYVPEMAGEETIHWLRHALLAGRGFDGVAVAKGPLQGFPWEKDPDHKFQVDFKFSGGTLDVYPADKPNADGTWPKGKDWPLFEGLAGHGTFLGDGMKITATQAHYKDVKLKKADVAIPAFSADTVWLDILASAQGPVSNFLQYVGASPVKEYTGGIFSKAKGTGDAVLNLALNLPLSGPGTDMVHGFVEVEKGQLALNQFSVPEFSSINGKVNFSEKGVDAKNLTGIVAGEKVTASLDTQSNGDIVVKASGNVSAPALKDILPGNWNSQLISRHFVGKTPFDLSATIGDKKTTIDVKSPLTGLEIKLPSPLYKSPQGKEPLNLNLTFDGPKTSVALTAGRMIAANLNLRNDRLVQGAVGIPTLPQMPSKGISVAANVPELNLEAWSSLLDEISSKNTSSKAVDFPDIGDIQIRVGKLLLNHFDQTDLRINAHPVSGGWKATVASNQLKGNIDWINVGPRRQPQLNATFSKLYIPTAVNEAAEEAKPINIEGGWPALNLVINDFIYGNFNLGKVVVNAHNTPSVHGHLWQITKLSVANSDGAMNASGSWLKNFNGSNRTTLLIDQNINNLGGVLGRLGQPGLIKAGNGTIKGELSWEGTPLGFNTQSFDGKLNIDLHKGEILKIEPGAGAKLLSLLSLQSLTRFLTLDLRDFYSKGFNFTTIKGGAQINDGIMNIKDLTMIGGQATVVTNGTVNIPRESQNLSILVLPDINAGAASAALAIANPIVGIGSFLAQLVLKDPLSKLFSFEYAVTGTWSDPIVKKKETHTSPQSLIDDILP